MLKESVKDSAGIFYFPPRFIYHSKVEKHNTIKRTLLPEIEKHLEENADKIVNRWVSSNVISSYHFDETNGEMLFNNEELMNAIWEAFNECVFFLDDDAWANLTEISKTAVVRSMWYNKYKPGGNQEIHNHIPHHFSGIYYLENTGIVTVPGKGFGQAEGTLHIRFTILPPEKDMDMIVERITKFHENFLKQYA